jgi:hypothetical protein
MKKFLFLIALAAFIAGAAQAQKPNHLTAKEKRKGWRLLFDGKTTTGWHSYGRDTVSVKWTVVDGMIVFDSSRATTPAARGGDLTTNESFENFEFSVEWKVAKGSNSGLIFDIQEIGKYRSASDTGPEMQVLDNIDASDNKKENHLAGQLYDLAGGAATSKPNPVGEWNKATVIQNHGHLTLIFNGITTYDGQMLSPEWNAMVANSKFGKGKNYADWGKVAAGKIAFQQHPGSSSWRNVKIRVL